MQLGITMRINGQTPKLSMDEVLEAERLGYVSVWSGEAWGTDAVSPVAWVLARTTKIKAGTAIMQMQARTPSCTAMTAMTLNALSGGRFLLGVGPSGPQVIEGWHGVAYGKPLGRTKEYIEIIRKALAREAPLTYQGEHYQIPYTGPGATNLGKPLRSIVHGDPGMKIYTASITPAGLRTAGEVSDGTLPIWFSPEQADQVVQPILDGRAKAGKPRDLDGFDLAPYVKISMGNDLAACRDALRPNLALYIGGMGARSKNFYNDFAVRLGYEEAAAKIQDLYLRGHKKDAEVLVPDKLIDEIALVGSADRIKDRLQAWKQVASARKLTTMVLTGASVEALRVVAEAVLYTAVTGIDLPDNVLGQWPFQARFARVNGWRMHYVDEGAGEAVVLLHGNPTWGFLYREFVAPLTSAGHRVIIPDMIGFGLSEKPVREQAHSLDGHIANLTGLLRGLDLRRITLVCHDWGGPTGLGFALSNIACVKALVLMSTWAWPLPPAEFHTRIFPWRMMHAPLIGPYLLGRHNALAGRGVYLSVVDRRRFQDRAQAAYEAVLPGAASRLLTWTWPRWIPLDSTARALDRFAWLERELSACTLPALLIWGREDDVFDPATFVPRFKQLLRHAEGPHLVTGRHFLQEDSGPAIAAHIVDFLGRLA